MAAYGFQMQASSPKSIERSGILEGHVSVIGGGSGGIGEATAWRFAREGAKVAIHYSGLSDRSVKKADDLIRRMNESGVEAMSIRADVSKYAEVKNLVESVVKRWGKVSSIVSFAGLPASQSSWSEDSLDLSDDDLLSAINVDFLGSYHFIRAAKDYMKSESHGKIVLIASSPAISGDEIGYRYTLAKNLNRMTVKSLATKLIREYHVYLNAIAPGTVDTPANRLNYSEDGWRDLVKQIPLQRAGLVDDIAGVALFLCSRLSDYVVGQTIVTDGGEIRL